MDGRIGAREAEGGPTGRQDEGRGTSKPRRCMTSSPAQHSSEKEQVQENPPSRDRPRNAGIINANGALRCDENPQPKRLSM